MRKEIKVIVRLAIFLAAVLCTLQVNANPVGIWEETPAGLPYCKYEPSSGSRFLLGNYRMNLLTHADGTYEILSGERVWARFNADPLRPDKGRNRATVTVGRKNTELVGTGASRNTSGVYSGVGFTRYDYNLEGGLKCSRMISVMPSDKINEGNPCFVITVTFTNTGRKVLTFSYEEAFSPEYVPVADQSLPYDARAFYYPIYTEIHFRCLKGFFPAESQKFIPLDFSETRSRHETHAQEIYLYANNAFLSINEGEFKAAYSDIRLRAGEKKTMHIVVGFSDGEFDKMAAENVMRQVQDGQFGAFELLWKKKLPKFSSESNRTTRREMYMNAYSLESSAVYSEFFNDTFIPAENNEAFHTGTNISNRDLLQRALSACYTNPELAKSTIRYVMKHSDYQGNVYDGNYGYGCAVPSADSCRDLQVMIYHTLAEYMRITRDYDILDEWVELYPMNKRESLKVMHILEKYFVYLRDDLEAEVNALEAQHTHALVSSYFPSFIEQIKASGKASERFMKALEEYSDFALASFRKSDDTLYDHMVEAHKSNTNSQALYDYFRAFE